MAHLPPSLLLEAQKGEFRKSLTMLDRQNTKAAFKVFLYALVPQFVRSRYYGDNISAPELTDSLWINGLRGVAILCLFNYHFLYAFTDMTAWPFGTDEHTWLIELPIIRLPYMGRPMVNIFLVTGGYLLSKEPLELMRRNDRDAQSQVLQLLSRWVFRRYFRLYLPTAAVALIVALAVYAGVYEFARRSMMDPQKHFPGIWKEAHLIRFPTIGEQLLLWWREVFRTAFVWEWTKFYPAHDDHLYLVRVVIQSSIGLTTMLFALSWMTENIRHIFLHLLSIYWMRFERWETVLFIWGACIAQMNVARKPHDNKESTIDCDTAYPDALEVKPQSAPARKLWGNQAVIFFRLKQFFRKWDWHIAFVLALYLMSAPLVWDKDGPAPGYMFIFKAFPIWLHSPHAVLPAIGSTMLFGCLTLCKPSSLCHKLLKGNFVQYLGRTLFSIYLVQGPVLHAGGYMVPHLIWNYVDKSALPAYCFGLVVGWTVSLMLTLWASDVFDREVDTRCLHFISWLEQFCCSKLA